MCGLFASCFQNKTNQYYDIQGWLTFPLCMCALMFISHNSEAQEWNVLPPITTLTINITCYWNANLHTAFYFLLWNQHLNVQVFLVDVSFCPLPHYKQLVSRRAQVFIDDNAYLAYFTDDIRMLRSLRRVGDTAAPPAALYIHFLLKDTSVERLNCAGTWLEDGVFNRFLTVTSPN